MLRPAEKRFIGRVQALEGGALQATRQLGGVGIAASPIGKPAGLVEVGDAEPRLAIRSDTLLECCVVELALSFQDALQGAMLRFAREQAVAIADNHFHSLASGRLTT